MAAVGDEGDVIAHQEGPDGVNLDAGGDSNNRLVIPPSIKAIWKRNIHSSDAFNEMNAWYEFNRAKAKAKREERARLAREAKRTRQEQGRMRLESEYPSASFAACTSLGNVGPDVKGSVQFPGASDSGTVPVDGWLVGFEADSSHALIVVCPVVDGIDAYYPILCPIEYIPMELRPRKGPKGKTKTEKKRREGKEWGDIAINTYPVKRGERKLHYVVDGPFEARTCDEAMIQSLRSGLVMVRGKSKPVFGATKVSFAKATRLPPSSVYTLSMDLDGMCLTHPSRGDTRVSERIYHCATTARHNRRESLDSQKKMLSFLEDYSASSGTASKRDICLNVVLNGECVLQEYGRIFHCAVQSERHTFPKDSFTPTPCTCDFAPLPDDCPPNIRKAIDKRNGPKVGHNYSSKSKA